MAKSAPDFAPPDFGIAVFPVESAGYSSPVAATSFYGVLARVTAPVSGWVLPKLLPTS